MTDELSDEPSRGRPATNGGWVSAVGSLPPGIIPYVEFHQGPRRLLTLDLTSGNNQVLTHCTPIVSIDGRQYVVRWGAVRFEIPADRNCHLSVHLEGERITQFVSMVLDPDPRAVGLRYATHYFTGHGTLERLG